MGPFSVSRPGLRKRGQRKPDLFGLAAGRVGQPFKKNTRWNIRICRTHLNVFVSLPGKIPNCIPTTTAHFQTGCASFSVFVVLFWKDSEVEATATGELHLTLLRIYPTPPHWWRPKNPNCCVFVREAPGPAGVSGSELWPEFTTSVFTVCWGEDVRQKWRRAEVFNHEALVLVQTSLVLSAETTTTPSMQQSWQKAVCTGVQAYLQSSAPETCSL